MISLTEAQELHEQIGGALEEVRSGDIKHADGYLERAREIAGLLVSDLDNARSLR